MILNISKANYDFEYFKIRTIVSLLFCFLLVGFVSLHSRYKMLLFFSHVFFWFIGLGIICGFRHLLRVLKCIPADKQGLF